MSERIDFGQLLSIEGVCELHSANKSEALTELCELLGRHPNVRNPEIVRQAIFDRERLVSTGIGIGVAIPHVKIPEVEDYTIVVGRHRQGLEFDALDGEPVHLVFLLAAAERQAGEFVRLLASVVRFVKDEGVRQRLLVADFPDEFLSILTAGV